MPTQLLQEGGGCTPAPMKFNNGNAARVWRLFLSLALIGAISALRLHAENCSCAAEQKLRYYLRGVTSVYGTVTFTVTVGNTVLPPITVSGGSGTPQNPVFECVQWPEAVMVEPKLDEPVKLEIETGPNTIFNPASQYAGIIVNTRPSSPCLKMWKDQNDEKWTVDPAFYDFVDVFRIKGSMGGHSSNVGESRGPKVHGGEPQADAPDFTDGKPIGDISIFCSGQGSFAPLPNQTKTLAAKTTTKTAKSKKTTRSSFALFELTPVSFDTNKLAKNVEYQPPKSQRPGKDGKGAKKKEKVNSVSRATVAASESTVSSAAGYSVANAIGKLRWEMSLGSVGRTLSQGRLIYQTDALDGTASSIAHLSIARGSDPKTVIRDGYGFLRQIELTDKIIDLTTNILGFHVDVYSKAGTVFDNGLFSNFSSPLLTWVVQNAGSGKITFTKTEGANVEAHEAEWQGTEGVAGTMTITRFGRWKEVYEYSLNGNQRIEIVSQYKDNVLQHKSRDVYQEFYNWGEVGEVFESLVEHVEDPDGKALKTSYTYYDSPGVPGNLLYLTTYPDGYSERINSRFIGNDYSPAVASGTPVQVVEPYRDTDENGPASQVTETHFAWQQNGMLQEVTETIKAGQRVGYRERYHVMSDQSLGTVTFTYADDSLQYTHEESWLDQGKRRAVFTLDQKGRTRYFYYYPGSWRSATQTFDEDPSVGDIAALKTVVINGTEAAPAGIANKTTVEVTIDDSFGHTLAEETYISAGSRDNFGALIDRKVHTYADGLLVSTTRNGRLIYRAQYYPDGKLHWEENESGQRTEYTYDELGNIYQKITRGRAGDPDQTFTYEYNVLGAMTREVHFAGDLSVETRSIYNLAGELEATIGIDGLTNFMTTAYVDGRKVVTETLPTQATRITSFYKDRSVHGVTGTAVEDEYRYPFVTFWWGPNSAREAVAVYRDSAMTQFKEMQVVNWLGNEILFETPRFGGGVRDRWTDYDWGSGGYTRQLPVLVYEDGRPNKVFTYDMLGRLSGQGLDLNDNFTLEAGGSDPMTIFDRYFTTNSSGLWEEVSMAQRFLQNNVATPTLIQRTHTIVPAALMGNIVVSNIVERVGGGTNISVVALDPSTGELLSTNNDLEHGQVSTRVERDGLLRSEQRPGVSTSWTYSYTPFGEIQTVTDPIKGTVTYSYDPATRRLLNVTHSLNRQTVYDYYPAGAASAGRLKGTRDADGNWTYFDYTVDGHLFRQWGVNVYPVEYEYNEAGQMTKMKTFRTPPGAVTWASSTWPNPNGGDVTQWDYDSATGLLQGKIYADNKTIRYGYDIGHFLNTKTNARNQVTTYFLNNAGWLTNVVYSDGTPSVTMSYDRAGRLASITDASGTRLLAWNERDEALAETYTNGVLDGLSLNRGYDAAFRPNLIELRQNGGVLNRQRLAYDQISRMDFINQESPDGATVLSGFDYTFNAGKPFVDSVAFSQGSVLVMTQNYNRDSIGRFAGASAVRSGASPTTLFSVNYQFDNLDRRFESVLADGTKWNFGYNNRGEVTSGKRKFSSGTFVGGEQFEYNYDDIGNRLIARFGGDAAGGNLRESTYGVASAVNQLTTRTVPGSIWLSGEAANTLTLMGAVNGRAVTIQRQEGEKFFGEATVDNSQSAVFARITVAGKSGTNLVDVQSGQKFIAKNPESFVHDDDGNLVSDGRWVNTWDCENRLKAVQSSADVPPSAQLKLEFGYDSQHRRIVKRVYNWNAGAGDWALAAELHFVYDGWNLVGVLDAENNLLLSFVWGLDLSGTLQGAGGVGGLLSITVHTGPNVGTYFYNYDGNGSVMKLINAATGEIAAEYEYGPFHEVIRASGPLARVNPFMAATKFYDWETGWNYYGYRYYDSSAGRWLSRDPIGLHGGLNEYNFLWNRALSYIDLLGLAGYFFDGTNNDKDRDAWDNEKAGNGPSNVAVLWSIYTKERFYMHGIGTRDGWKNGFGLVGGLGGATRIEEMLKFFEEQKAKGDCTVDIVGFSRGAATAREFANRIKDKYPNQHIRWLGIFDTVASFGFGGNDVNPGYRMKIPDNVDYVFHLIAADEKRYFFPLSSIKPAEGSDPTNPNWREISMPGVHSDIGGGYRNHRSLANIALRFMHADGIRHQVPFGPIPKEYLRYDERYIHDSRWLNDKIGPITPLPWMPVNPFWRPNRQIYYYP